MARLRLTAAAAIVSAMGASPALAQGGVPALQEWPKLHTPDQITPAVIPYLACLYALHGLPPLRSSDGAEVSWDKSSSDCSAARAKAMADATRLLQEKQPPSSSSSAALIERTLSDIDAYVASLPLVGAGGANRTAMVGVPITIEDEVQPAYNRYDDCLKTQVSNSTVTAATIIDKFKQAMTLCAGVRDYAVQEATKALTAKGWDETTRRRVAETTFAKADQSWMAMGVQYREAMIEWLEQASKHK